MTSIDPTRHTPDASLDLPAVEKHNWKSQEHRDAWDGRLGRFSSAFDRAMEAALVDDEHPRTGLRRTLPTDDAIDLVARVSDAVDIARKSGDRTTTVGLTTPACDVDADALLDGVESQEIERSIRGIPECCADAHRDAREAGFDDPIAEIARNTPRSTERGGELVVEDPHPVLNRAWAYLGWRFVDFHPCSFECDAAREVAIQNGRLLRETGHGETADAMFEFLASPTYWSGYHGLAHVKNGWCIGEYTTDDYWSEEVVRFNGYHDSLAGSSSEGC
ncbi:hypothetical protein [Halovivax cerinus]|uniref:Uncharacterized protein n=1 Tax=Halovivax cerinus TaxID=1487865 RepID=A0ABD5NKR8_9EURY|nr:hypothetical protein [Halovivax cerinus]